MPQKKKGYAGFFRPYLARILLTVALSAVSTVCAFQSSQVLGNFVDQIRIADNFLTLLQLIVIWAVYTIIQKNATATASSILLPVRTNTEREIRFTILGKLAGATIETVSKNSPISLAEHSSDDVKQFLDAVHGIYSEAFSLVLGIAALCYTAVVSLQIFTLFIISFIIILLFNFFMMKKMLECQSQARASTISSKDLLSQVIQGFADIKVQGLTQGLKPILTESLEKELKDNASFNKLYITTTRLLDTISILSQVAFLALASYLLTSDRLSVAVFFTLYQYRHHVYNLANVFLHIAKSSSQLKTAKNNMDKILCYKAVTRQEWGHSHLLTPTGNVSFQNVSVTYGDGKVLNDLSVDLPANSFIGIVGESGCGKSTLLNVLTRAVPYSGSVLVDGFHLTELDESSLRKTITLAPQMPFLFDFSIKQNMLLANPNASDAEIWDCLKRCSADKFVHEHGGLETVLTPKELSGGQRQRLALARMTLKGGKIILLDESTSALDGQAQDVILHAAREASKNHTVVMVAHRVSCLKAADIILVMDKGKVFAQGTYDELYTTCEKFRHLADLG